MYDVKSETGVRIPEPISHITKSAILISSDLGNVQPLSALFRLLSATSLEVESQFSNGNMGYIHGQIMQTLPLRAETALDSYFKSAGTKLGGFLAKIHNPQVRKELANFTNPPIPPQFARREDERARNRESIRQMVHNLHSWPAFPPLLLSEYTECLSQDVNRLTNLDEWCFSHGNFNLDSILVEPPSGDEIKSVNLGVVSWSRSTF